MKKYSRIILVVIILILIGSGTGIFMGLKMKDTSAHGHSAPEIKNGVMTAETLLSFGRLSDARLSPDGKYILYSVRYADIKENSMCSNLYICNSDGSGNHRISRYKAGECPSNARWSSDGSHIYYIRKGSLRKLALKDGKCGKETDLGKPESGIVDFCLSDDESNILYITEMPNKAVSTPSSSDTTGMMGKALAYSTEDLMYRHWDHWVLTTPRSFVAAMGENGINTAGAFDILGDEPYELPMEPFGGMEQLCWAPDGRHIAYSCKKLSGKHYAFSTNACIYIYDIVTGETTQVTYKGGYDTDPVWSADGKHLAWVSMERDGYESDERRLFVADIEFPSDGTDGQNGSVCASNIRQLASGLDRDVESLLWDGDNIYFAALSDGVKSIFRVNLNDELTRITPADWWYDFSTPFAVLHDGDEVRLLSSYCSHKFPAELVEVNADGSGFRQLSHENEPILEQLNDFNEESVSVKTVDGKEMQCWVMYPPKYNPGKRYPAIEIVLGGPQGTNSQDWSYRWCYRLMAQQGYIVILPNRRGTSAFGQEWKEQISGDYCGLNMQDYLSAGRWLRENRKISKLACVGASYGGYSAYMLEGLHGDLFDCFIAHAGIFDEKQLWFTTEEMWFANWDNGGLTEYCCTDGEQGPRGDGVTFGGIQQAGAPYADTPKAQRHYANSPSSMVKNWHTPILCIHGMMDFRIPYEQGMAAFNAAQMMGVPSRLVLFPEETHWVVQPQNSLYWHKEVYDWLERWLKNQ